MNVCTTFFGKVIDVKIQYFTESQTARTEESEDLQCHYNSSSGDHEYLYFMAGDISLTTNLMVEEKSGDQQNHKATSIWEFSWQFILKDKSPAISCKSLPDTTVSTYNYSICLMLKPKAMDNLSFIQQSLLNFYIERRTYCNFHCGLTITVLAGSF